MLRLELEVEVLGVLHDGHPAAGRALRRAQFLRTVRRAAVIAAVAVLVRRTAPRARPLHESVGKEHLAVLAIELRSRLLRDEALLFRRGVDALRKLLVLRRVRRVVVIERDLEVGEVLEMRLVRASDQLLGGDALLARTDHDRSPVRIVRADVDALVAAQLLEPHPEVGLDVLDEMPEMDVTVRVRKRARDDNSSIAHYGEIISKL